MINLKNNILINSVLSLKNDIKDVCGDTKLFFVDAFKDKVLITLLLIFSFMYLPHAFILVEDLNLILAYEVDPGSHIAAIEDILRSYSMHKGYHSKFYGWTFFAINFLLLFPIKFLSFLLGSDLKLVLYLSIKLIFFGLSSLSLIAFYSFLKKVFQSKILSVFGSLFYIFSAIGYSYFYFIHPETTGIMFIFFALINFLNFLKDKDGKYYKYGLFLLVLASLSKQIFFFISLPIMLLYLYFYYNQNLKECFKNIKSKKFISILFKTFIFSLFVFFVIHPFAFFEPLEFIDYQKSLTVFVNGQYSLALADSSKKWLEIILNVKLLKFFIFLSPVVILSFFVNKIKKGLLFKNIKKSHIFLFYYNFIFLIILSSLIVYGNRMFIGATYLQPIFPFFIIFFISILYFLLKNNVKILYYPLVYILVIIFISDSYNVFNSAKKRFLYKDSMAFTTYNYIKKNIAKDKVIVYDHFVATPSDYVKSCHYWHGCGNKDHLLNVDPDYIMFNPNRSINNKEMDELKVLKNHVKLKNMTLMDSLKVDDISILIYKK